MSKLDPIQEGLPAPGDDESLLEYGDRIAEELLEWRRKQRLGGSIDPTEKRTIRYFGQTYAFINGADRYYLTKQDFQDGVNWGTKASEEVTEHKLTTFPEHIAGYFKRLGWFEVNAEFLPNNHGLVEEELIHVSRKCPDLKEIKQMVKDGDVLTRTSIQGYIHEDSSYLDARIEEDDDDLVASIAAVETQANTQGWLLAGGLESNIRIWISPNSLINTLDDIVQDEEQLTSAFISQSILDYIDNRIKDLPSEHRIDVGRAIKKFEKQLRARGWKAITLQDDKIWHSNPTDHKEELDEYINNYSNIIKNAIEFTADEIYPILQFIRNNKKELVRADIWEGHEVNKRIRRLNYHVEADERFTELEKSEPTYRFGKVG